MLLHISSSFPFIIDKYSFVWIDYNLFSHLVDRYFGYFQLADYLLMNQINVLNRFLSYNLSLGSHICILYAMQGDYYFATFTKSNNILIFLF